MNTYPENTMLLFIQFALGITFIGLLILSLCDAIKGTLIILSGLVLLAVGYGLKGVVIALRQIQPTPAPVAPPVVTRRVPTWTVTHQ